MQTQQGFATCITSEKTNTCVVTFKLLECLIPQNIFVTAHTLSGWFFNFALDLCHVTARYPMAAFFLTLHGSCPSMVDCARQFWNTLWRPVAFGDFRKKKTPIRRPWPTLPGPGRQPLGGSISLKFLLEPRLQSEFIYTLDDLLGFRVQKV